MIFLYHHVVITDEDDDVYPYEKASSKLQKIPDGYEKWRVFLMGMYQLGIRLE